MASSLWVMLFQAQNASRDGRQVQVITPTSWLTSTWFARLYQPYLARVHGATFESHKRFHKFCTEADSSIAVARQPFTRDLIPKARSVALRSCNISTSPAAVRTPFHVLFYNRPMGLRRHRAIVNIVALEVFLARRGISYLSTVIPPDPCDQLQLLSRAHHVIVSPHGAHLTNLIAMQPQVEIVEVMPMNYQFPLYCRIGQALGNPW